MIHTTRMDDDLIQKLLFAESDFSTALKGGADVLASYSQTWSLLPDILHTASETKSVGNETLYLAHSVASRIANLANCFLDIKQWEQSFTTSLQRDCDAILHQMAALDLDAIPKTPQPDDKSGARISPSYSGATISIAGGSSPFVATAHQWLLDNLHNPYPSTTIKARMAASSSCQISSINSWFINARRRIGWTKLCRERFSNCRADMLDAAYRALVEEDPQRALSPQLIHSFVEMKVAAEGLYPSTSTMSAFAGDLDAMVKDMAEEDGKSDGAQKCSQVDKANPVKATQNSYPSPEPSITASPVFAVDAAVTEESEEEVDVTPPIFAGSKRRRSSIEPVDMPSSGANRPVKRLRASMSSRTCFPSPPSSTDGVHESSDRSSPVLSTPPETNEVLSPCEHPSDVDATGMPKCPNSSTTVPSLHTVPDPHPRPDMGNEYSIDDWFKTNFDDLFAIPPPVDATVPDFSAAWEVELFKDYSIPGNEKHTSNSLPAPTPDTRVPTMIDLSNFDGLLQSVGSDTLFVPSDNALLTNATEATYTPSLDLSIPDFSHANIDWMSLLNATETYQPTVYSTFPQYPIESQPLPEIDLSMLQLPQVMPAVDPQGDLASKQARLHQYHAMQEAVWRMEQELRSEGVVV